ncbi:hypothetical protein HH1059_15050 [Halorhodospira halochloris]|uniref:Uncharacterized protein n=1 Tax=Halorhodospira halochloris TaxID=1052 RepID=A0A2Z6EZP2_HALHR|nr:hypothetical protein HH1059_15050 [Halorhodospira halochloris]
MLAATARQCQPYRQAYKRRRKICKDNWQDYVAGSDNFHAYMEYQNYRQAIGEDVK